MPGGAWRRLLKESWHRLRAHHRRRDKTNKIDANQTGVATILSRVAAIAVAKRLHAGDAGSIADRS
jgi:hypothetical protein